MKKEAEYGTKVRVLRILRALLERPLGYTKRQLAERYGVSVDTIDHDFNAFRSAGFLLKKDERYRYAFVEDKPYKTLKDLLHFSEEDQLLLMQAIDQVAPHTHRGEMLKRKLSSLYDYHRLGHAYLRRPYLSKLDALKEAMEENRQVVLQDYHSTNSNIVSDRLVEPFHLNPPEDIVQTFDIDKKELRYFRISRFSRVRPTGQPWAYKERHVVMPADPFRIVDPKQEMVHIRLKVGAYNDLVERFPLCKAYVQPAAEPDIYDMQCLVNHQFIGLTNFLLGNFQGVEVIETERLRKHLRELAGCMRF
jgi:predicted DNA-binding transcriptional regulator YafY